MKYLKKHTVDNFDLNKHAIIEASAGTGKTYTIERIVAELIINGEKIENILVVTYTEKATAELKHRIHKTLIDALEEKHENGFNGKTCIEIGHKQGEYLQNALDDFDKANIYTIHGFCNKILSEYPVETKSYFKNEMVDDNEFFDSIIYEYLRRVFINDAKNAEVLKYYLLNNDNKLDSFINEFRDIFFTKGEVIPKIKRVKKNISKCILKMRKFIENDFDLFSDYDEFLNKTTIEKGFRKDYYFDPLRNIYIELKELFNFDYLKKVKSDENIFAISRFLVSLDLINKDVSKRQDKFNKINQNFYKAKTSISKENVFEKFEGLKDFLDALNDLASFAISLKQLLFLLMLDDFRDYFGKEKQKNGLISYDDMIKRVENVITSPDNWLSNILQNKYKRGLIDEFQDTDDYQWNIFKKIFTEKKDNFLYLIGDPKQSIYSFRGADVYTYLEAKKYIKQIGGKEYALTYNQRSTQKIVRCAGVILNGPPFLSDNRNDDLGRINFVPAVKAKSARENKGNELYIVSGKDRIKDDSVVFMCVNNEKDGTNEFNEDAMKANDYKKTLANFIASEIDSILNEKRIRYVDERKTTEDNKCEFIVEPEDIAILCYSGKDAQYLKSILTMRNIPCSIYKESGLFKTEEAKEILYILKAVNAPEDRAKRFSAYLTSFYNFTLSEIKQIDETDVGQKLIEQFNKWKTLALRRDFKTLFNSILTDTGIKTRILIFNNDERKITNYEHIFEVLLERTSKHKFSLIDIIEFLILQTTLDNKNDENLLKLETEKNTVKLMTIHAAKGLEFNVVFMYGGFGKNNKQKDFIFHREENGILKKYLDITQGKLTGNKDFITEEGESEEKNLIYVAMTRAKLKLYLPFIYGNLASKINGRYSHILTRFLGKDHDYENALTKLESKLKGKNNFEIVKININDKTYSNVLASTSETVNTGYDYNVLINNTSKDIEPLKNIVNYLNLLIPHKTGQFLFNYIDKNKIKKYYDNGKLKDNLSFEEIKEFKKMLIVNRYNDMLINSVSIDSFSHLKKLCFESNYKIFKNEISAINENNDKKGDEKFLDDETDSGIEGSIDNRDGSGKNELSIPGGKISGLIVHSLLENVDFVMIKNIYERFNSDIENAINEILKNEEYVELLEKLLKKFNLNTDENIFIEYKKLFTKEIYKVLTAKIKVGNLEIVLCKIPPEEAAHEIHFYYPNVSEKIFLEDDIIFTGENIDIENEFGFIQGFIDFVFKHSDGKYYFIDWKTNKSNDYSPEGLAKLIGEAHYDVQYGLYSIGLALWLITFFKNKTNYNEVNAKKIIEEKFGGIFYIFSRGLDEQGNGVFFREVNWDDLIEYQDYIKLKHKGLV